jgi:alpha-methylacyl-CoA racemase
LTEAIAKRTLEECEVLFAQSEVCFAPVLDMDEAPRNPQNMSRDTFYFEDGAAFPSPGPRFSRTPAARPNPPRARGADGHGILAELGLRRSEIDRLYAVGAAWVAKESRPNSETQEARLR